ncbi:YciI family protein [Camelliibacillus cellulosilyticus]|uniref:YciI family protein n=1 Tax=Camelliibacillus cellulosilyticus TaxID=2174486 RepID=A0ABV9GPB7_9BACL
MKTFVVHLSGKQKNLLTHSLLTKHVGYLRHLKEVGVLPFCGPCKDDTALMIIKAETLEEAHGRVEADPFAQVNYYQNRRIVEIEEANESNHFLLG